MESLFDNCESEHIKADTLSMHDVCGSCAECITKHGAEFKAIFGVDIKRFMSGIHYIMGFDIVGFDQHVIRSGVKCMKDVVIDQYGQRANDLLTAILDYPKI